MYPVYTIGGSRKNIKNLKGTACNFARDLIGYDLLRMKPLATVIRKVTEQFNRKSVEKFAELEACVIYWYYESEGMECLSVFA